jgi:hypothetical protein
VLLLTTRSGRELLIRIPQLALRPEPEADERVSHESDVQEDVHDEPAEDADVEEVPEEDTTGDDESEVTDLNPRIRRPRRAQEGAGAEEGCQRLALLSRKVA